jgi:hypothetical protein
MWQEAKITVQMVIFYVNFDNHPVPPKLQPRFEHAFLLLEHSLNLLSRANPP